MRTVILTPYRRSPQRDPLWRFVQHWIETHYPFPVFVGDSDGPFSRAQARNNAAAAAGDWDVAIFHDSDTIAHPDAIHAAIAQAANSLQMVVAADSHMYCDPQSTDRILTSGLPMFARPNSFDSHGIYEKPCSGVFAVSRELFTRTGGYVDLQGWGYEDLVWLQQCNIFGDGNTWIEGHITLHLWHPPADRTEDTRINRGVWQTLTKYRRRRDIDGARTYLASLGHIAP